jgi:hypothetical protein
VEKNKVKKKEWKEKKEGCGKNKGKNKEEMNEEMKK